MNKMSENLTMEDKLRILEDMERSQKESINKSVYEKPTENEKIPAWLREEGVKEFPPWITSREINLEGTRKMRVFYNALRKTGDKCFKCNRHFTQFLNDGKSNPNFKKIKPHHVFHDGDGGPFIEDNIVPLCGDCHKEEYKFYKKCRSQRSSLNRKEMIEWSFNMFRIYLRRNANR